jgi:hypothetical protein
MRVPQRTVNLVRDIDSDTYEVMTNGELLLERAKATIVPEKQRVQGSLYGYFYIRMPK